MKKEQGVYEVAQRAAQRFLRGEIYYQDAINSVLDVFSQEYVSANFEAAQAAAEDLLDGQLIALENTVIDGDQMYDVAEEAAQDFLSGKIDYNAAVFRVRSMLPPTYVKRNPEASRIAAENLLDEVLNSIKTSTG